MFPKITLIISTMKEYYLTYKSGSDLAFEKVCTIAGINLGKNLIALEPRVETNSAKHNMALAKTIE